MFDYRLALATGVDIPIPELQLTMHQPTIKEISMIGETNFFSAIQLLCIQKSMYSMDDLLLPDITNFQIFMTLMNDPKFIEKKNSVLQILTLLFDNSTILFTPRSLIINHDTVSSIIDEGNFENIQKIWADVFCLRRNEQDAFNPGGSKAQEIANKILKARKKVSQIKAKEQGNESTLGQYLSILTVGVHSMSLQNCINLTIYQLYDLIERYTLYMNWDLDIRSRLAGAKGDKPIDNWMKSIHSN